ncbi:MAG: 4-(cytidine 5'-diphospho)-2-C-methyl-D-erythritol kinase, partial [Pseudomonadota bacterium]
GGGSADAGAALRILVKAHGGKEAEAQATAIAPSLGGDVLACFYSLPGVMTGEGDQYAIKLGIPALPAVLVNPRLPCPTASVFAAYDTSFKESISQAIHPNLPNSRINADTFITWLTDNTRNDLETSAITLIPKIGEVLAALKAMRDCRLARMSGSGATCFGVFSSMEDANIAADALRSHKPNWWVRATLLGSGANI